MIHSFSSIAFSILDTLCPPENVIAAFFLVLCRIVPIVHTAPFLAAKNMPIPVKMGMAVGLFPFMLPNIFIFSQGLNFGSAFLCLMCKELLIGYFIGISLSLPFFMMMMAGSSIDHQRGASSLMFSDPIIQIQDSSIGILFMYTLAVMFWNQNIPFLIFEFIAKSFEIIPIDKMFSQHLFNGLEFLTLSKFTQIIGLAFSTSIQIAAPALVVLLMVDTFLGITNRIAPQVQISFLGQSLKAFAGILVVLICWEPFLLALFHKSVEWIKYVTESFISISV